MSLISALIRNAAASSRKSRGGVHVAYNKNTKDMTIVEMPAPQRVVLPLRQHIGIPCVPQVKVGDEVRVGQIIADNEGLCAPVHASVSGKVIKIGDYPTTMGLHTPAVEIESDGKMERWQEDREVKVQNLDEFLEAVRLSGYVGLGGAGFPSFFKLRVPEGKKVEYLLINAAECEPYITVDYRRLLEDKEAVLKALELISFYLQIPEIVLGIEDNKPQAIEMWTLLARESEGRLSAKFRVLALPSSYPQGAEKVLIKMCTGREVPPGKLPLDCSCIVMNVSTVAGIGHYFLTGQPLVRRNLTCDGSAIREPKNLSVPLGTSIEEVISFCGGFRTSPRKILMGGPMMGIALDRIDQPVLKYNNAILALSEEDLPRSETIDPCIRCGSCVSVCPMNLMPTTIKRYSSLEDPVMLERSGVMVCMECGSCAYACPAHIPLVQYLRLGKSIVRKAGQK